MKKTYLLTPGPTPLPEPVLRALGSPLIHHRTPAFQKLFEEVKAGLQQVFQTRQEVLMLASTGTGAMDAAVCNLFSPGQKVITVNGGKFGERWGEIARAYGLDVVELKTPRLGDPVDLSTLRDTVRTHSDARAILFQASETSTGVLMPTSEICEIARRANMLSVCDAITACGVYDLPMDRWEIDVLITGSQKALMIPPGMAFIALSPRAWQACENARLPRFYFDLRKERTSWARNQSAWTPATSHVMALRESVKLILEEGLPKVFARHQKLAKASRAAVEAMGLEILAKRSPSPAVTAVVVPSTIKDGKAIPRLMREKYGVTIAGGQGELEGKIFRLSHFGYCDLFDISTGIASLELVLNELGHPVEFGKGTGAALKVFSAQA